jgi:hypothetical protein
MAEAQQARQTQQAEQDRTYELGLFKFTLTATGELLLTVATRVQRRVPVTDISGVRLTGGINNSYCLVIEYRDGGKAKKMPLARVRWTNEALHPFVRDLAATIPAEATLDDRTAPDLSDLSRERVYPLCGRLLFDVVPRWTLVMFWWIAGVSLVLLPLSIWVSRRYRLRTSAEGLTVARLGTAQAAWSEIQRYRCARMGRRRSPMLRVTLETSGKPISFVLEGIAGNQLLAELDARGIQGA